MKKYILTFLLVLFPLFLLAADPQVDTYVDMEDSSNGTTLTATIANNGRRGAGTFSVTGTGMKVSTTSERALRGPVQVVGGSSYNDSGGTRTWQVPNHTALQYAQMYFAGGSKSIVVMSGYITPNQLTTEYNMTDYIVVDGTTSGTGYGVFQLENSGAKYGLQLHAQNYSPNAAIYSTWIPVTKGSTYWFTFRCNGTTGLCELEVYDPTTWSLLSPGRVTVTIPVERRSAFGWVKIGRADNHTVGATTTYTYFDDLCINYTDTTFPFVPTASGGGGNAPSISVQPVGVTNRTSTGFTLNVTAGGDVPLRYQWRTNTTAILDATNSTYGSSPATTNQSGSYNVVITNASGSITSSTVSVSITNSTTVDPPTFGGIPTNRLSQIAWRAAGIPGGIPNRTTIYTNLSVGVTAAQIQAAINACPSNQVVKLAAGTYNLSANITIGVKDGWTLRGAGMRQTILNFTAGGATAFSIGGSPPWDGSWLSPVNITVAALQGETNLTLADAANFSIGDHAVIDMVNSGWIVGYGTGGGTTASSNPDSAGRLRDGNRVQLHYGVIKNKIGNNLTFWPPLPFDLDAARTPQLSKFVSTGGKYRGPVMAGLEDLQIKCGGTGARPLDIVGFHAFWLKNIEITDWGGLAAIYARRGSCMEIRGCFIHDPNLFINSHGYGMQLDPISGSLIEDNIIYRCESNFLLQGGCAGNVIAYNVSAFGKYVDPSYSGEWLQHDISLNHTPFPCYNLMEGNYTTYVQSDYYYGPSGWTTIFRNRIAGNSASTTLHRLCVAIDSNNRYYSVVANQLGERIAPSGAELLGVPTNRVYTQPGSKTWIYDMPQNAGYNPNYIYRWGFPYSGRNDIPGTGLATRDQDVVTNTVVNLNWDAFNNAVVYDNSGDTTAPDSFYLDSKPEFFRSLDWPPYGPSAPDASGPTNDLAKIPAGYRLVYNTDPPAATPPTNPPTITLTDGSGTVGSYFSYTAYASEPPITGWGASNLPTGLSMSGAVISGTPTIGTTNTVTLLATNVAGNSSGNVTFRIADIPPAEELNYIGNTNQGTSQLDILNAGDLSGAQYTAQGTFSVTNIFARVAPSTGYWKFAIYTATSNLLAGTSGITNADGGWISGNLSAPVSITNGQIYWLVAWSSASSYLYYSSTDVPATRYDNQDVSASWPSVLVMDTTGANLNYSMYAFGGDFTGPEITITSPANDFDTVIVDSVTFSGTASDDQGVASVTATNLTTGAAIALTGTTTWTGTATALALGLNNLSVTATDGDGNSSTTTIYSNYQFRRKYGIGRKMTIP